MTSTAALHDAYAADYDDQVRAYGSYVAEVLFGLCYEYIEPGQSMLDVGIGTGLSAALFARAGLSVCGMDFSPAMLDLCRAKGVALDLVLHDVQATPWPYPADAFAHVVCCGVLHFVPELEPIFRETARVLQEGGLFALTTKAPGSVTASRGTVEQATVVGFDIYSHAPEYVQNLLAQSGFEQLKVLRCYVGQDLFYVWVARKRRKLDA